MQCQPSRSSFSTRQDRQSAQGHTSVRQQKSTTAKWQQKCSTAVNRRNMADKGGGQKKHGARVHRYGPRRRSQQNNTSSNATNNRQVADNCATASSDNVPSPSSVERLVIGGEEKRVIKTEPKTSTAGKIDFAAASAASSSKQHEEVLGPPLQRQDGDGSSHSDKEEDPETEELARLRCTSERTEVIAERENRRKSRQRRCADYPGLAFGSSIFSSDTLMKFSIIKNELHNILNSQLKRSGMVSFGGLDTDMTDGSVRKAMVNYLTPPPRLYLLSPELMFSPEEFKRGLWAHV